MKKLPTTGFCLALAATKEEEEGENLNSNLYVTKTHKPD